MALTRVQVEKWLVGQCRSHLERCKFSVAIDGTNPDLNDPIWDGLRRFGLHPSDPTAVATADMATIGPASYSRFLLACLIEVKRRVLNHYRSQVTQGVIASRIEFDKRAKGLAEDIEADEVLYEQLLVLTYPDGAIGSPFRESTNVPDAICLPYIP